MVGYITIQDWELGKSDASTKTQQFPIHFQWEPLWSSCDGRWCIRWRLSPQTCMAPEVVPSSNFWAPQSASHCGSGGPNLCVLQRQRKAQEMGRTELSAIKCAIKCLSPFQLRSQWLVVALCPVHCHSILLSEKSQAAMHFWTCIVTFWCSLQIWEMKPAFFGYIWRNLQSGTALLHRMWRTQPTNATLDGCNVWFRTQWVRYVNIVRPMFFETLLKTFF